MVTSTSRPFAAILVTLPPWVVMSTPSRRTCRPETNPEPKIFTPDRLQVPAGEPAGGTQVNVACGTKALGMPPITPTPGVGLGTTTPEIWVGFNGVVVPGPPKSTMS